MCAIVLIKMVAGWFGQQIAAFEPYSGEKQIVRIFRRYNSPKDEEEFVFKVIKKFLKKRKSMLQRFLELFVILEDENSCRNCSNALAFRALKDPNSESQACMHICV